MMKVVDVSEYILEETDQETQITTMKLQKLCYYAQAWSLVWDERPLFNERMEAWANGPVCPALFDAHKGKFLISSGMTGGNSDNLDEDAKETIDAVLSTYGDKSAPWLSDLTHREDPWRKARAGLAEEDRGANEITHGAMTDYYGNLKSG